MHDAQRHVYYDDTYHEWYVTLLFKNPPGRIQRKQWRYKNRILPDFQSFFSNAALKSQKNAWYYNADYLKMGNIVEKTNFYYPSDDSLIFQKRQLMGDTSHCYCGVVNESYTLSMAPQAVLVDCIDTATKLLVEYKEEKKSFSLDVTLESGLVLKFLDNGDIMQTL